MKSHWLIRLFSWYLLAILSFIPPKCNRVKVLICYYCLPGASGERFCVVTNISTTWCQRNAGKYQQSTSLESKGCKPAGKGRQKITLVCPSPAPTVACARSNDISTIWYWCWLNSTATWKLT